MGLGSPESTASRRSSGRYRSAGPYRNSPDLVSSAQCLTGGFHPRRWREMGKSRHHPALERDRARRTHLTISPGIQLLGVRGIGHHQLRHFLVGGLGPIKIRLALLIAPASGQPPANPSRTRPGTRALGGIGAAPTSRLHTDSSGDTNKISARPHACPTRRTLRRQAAGRMERIPMADTAITDRAVHPAGTRSQDHVRSDTPCPCRPRPCAGASPVTQLRTDPPQMRSSFRGSRSSPGLDLHRPRISRKNVDFGRVFACQSIN